MLGGFGDSFQARLFKQCWDTLRLLFQVDEKHTLSQEDPSFFGMALTSKYTEVPFFLEHLVSGPRIQLEQGSARLPSQTVYIGSGEVSQPCVDMALFSSEELQWLYFWLTNLEFLSD